MCNLPALLHTVSYAGFAILFAESGFLVGIILPGDSLLITAGLLSAQGSLSAFGVVIAALLGAVLGDTTGYGLGRRLGPAVFRRPESRFLGPAYVVRARSYFERYGVTTLVIARFVPVVRTLVPTTAGVGRMHYPTFAITSWAACCGGRGSRWRGLSGAADSEPRPLHPAYCRAGVRLSLVPLGLELRKQRRATTHEGG